MFHFDINSTSTVKTAVAYKKHLPLLSLSLPKYTKRVVLVMSAMRVCVSVYLCFFFYYYADADLKKVSPNKQKVAVAAAVAVCVRRLQSRESCKTNSNNNYAGRDEKTKYTLIVAF